MLKQDYAEKGSATKWAFSFFERKTIFPLSDLTSCHPISVWITYQHLNEKNNEFLQTAEDYQSTKRKYGLLISNLFHFFSF